MASIFQPITFVWDGEKRTIPADRVMKCIEMVEAHITLKELSEAAVRSGGGLQMTRLTAGYAAALEFAGFKGITHEKVYAGMFGSGDFAVRVRDAVTGLLHLMIPPSSMESLAKEAEDEGRKSAGKKKPVAGASSSRRTRSRSASGESQETTSGQ